jgi:hypothetical protein
LIREYTAAVEKLKPEGERTLTLLTMMERRWHQSSTEGQENSGLVVGLELEFEIERRGCRSGR